jgi:hypothetical protein
MSNEVEQNFWRRCGSCKKEIGFGVTYQVCGITSCQKHAYCSVDCWSLHNSILNHKSAWSEDRYSPSKAQYLAGAEPGKKRIIVAPSASPVSPSGASEEEILIVASKLKQYVKDKHDMNTSGKVMEELSDIVRRAVDHAVVRARSDSRKTLMERDFH